MRSLYLKKYIFTQILTRHRTSKRDRAFLWVLFKISRDAKLFSLLGSIWIAEYCNLLGFLITIWIVICLEFHIQFFWWRAKSVILLGSIWISEYCYLLGFLNTGSISFVSTAVGIYLNVQAVQLTWISQHNLSRILLGLRNTIFLIAHQVS